MVVLSLEQFTAQLIELLDSLGKQPEALKLRRQVGAFSGKDLAGLSSAAVQCGRILAETSRPDDARGLFSAMAEMMPQRPMGSVALARLACLQGSWFEAVQRWDDCLRRFPQYARPDWTAERARAAAQLAVGDAAAPLAVASSCTAPTAEPQRMNGVSNVAVPKRPLVEAMVGAEHGAPTDAFMTILATMRNLLRAGRLSDAQMEYKNALMAATTSQHFRALYMIIGPLFDDWERTSTLLHLRTKLTDLASSFSPRSRREIETVQLRICLSLRDYRGLLDGFAKMTSIGPLPPEDRVLEAIVARVGSRPFPNYLAEKVFGIGLSKTGTTSLIAALGILGYDAVHWTNPATHELLVDDDLNLFDAFADLPVCEHFEQLYYTYPNAKFVYTTRPLESWKRSYLKQIRARDDASFAMRRARAMQSFSVVWGSRHARLSLQMYYNHESLEEAYRTYDRRVRRFFADMPTNRFLEFSLSDGHGWPEICGFLCRPVPNVPYPRKNPQKAAGTA